MSKIEIVNERLANAVRTTDAVAAFMGAVENGQSRLALDILGDMLPTLLSRLDELESAVASKAPSVTVDEPKINSEPVTAAPVAKAASKSAKAKEADTAEI
jgi:hypothetical protein